MTNADMIRQMTDEELVNLLVWDMYGAHHRFLPDCSDDCKDLYYGCGARCPQEKHERAIRKWLEAEAE